MARVYFVREKISMEVPLGVTVLEAEIRAGLEPDAPCGGLRTMNAASGTAENGW